MEQFEQACRCCREHWVETPSQLQASIQSISRIQQKDNERNASVLLKQLKERFEENAQQGIRDQDIQDWMKNDHMWNLSWLNEDEKDSFLGISKSFIKDARQFDEKLAFADIGQALRNVWIFAILEKLFQRPLYYHKAIFAYSMLYPYTDNFLDDENISRTEKQAFNDWFTRRLRGECHPCESAVASKVSALVLMIEEQFPRVDFPEVYEALLLIQEGQKKSLLQNEIKDEHQLLAISIEKGGASVLADGYLIDGRLTSQELRFCVEYGFMLQIADDIQDVVEDGEQGYHTLLSIQNKGSKRSTISVKLLNYIEQVIHNLCPNKDRQVQRFVMDNCMLLVFFSVIKNHHLYPKTFLYSIKKYLPVKTKFLENFLEEGKEITQDDKKLLAMMDAYLMA